MSLLWKIQPFSLLEVVSTEVRCNECQLKIKLSNYGPVNLNSHLTKQPACQSKFKVAMNSSFSIENLLRQFPQSLGNNPGPLLMPPPIMLPSAGQMMQLPNGSLFPIPSVDFLSSYGFQSPSVSSNGNSPNTINGGGPTAFTPVSPFFGGVFPPNAYLSNGMFPSQASLLPQLSGKRKRRHRTIFSEEQLSVLETTFSGTQYPDVGVREKLAVQCDLKEERVEVWFKNRRAKERKKNRDASLSLTNSSLNSNNARQQQNGSRASSDGNSKLNSSDSEDQEEEEGDDSGSHSLSPNLKDSQHSSLKRKCLDPIPSPNEPNSRLPQNGVHKNPRLSSPAKTKDIGETQVRIEHMASPSAEFVWKEEKESHEKSAPRKASLMELIKKQKEKSAKPTTGKKSFCPVQYVMDVMNSRQDRVTEAVKYEAGARGDIKESLPLSKPICTNTLNNNFRVQGPNKSHTVVQPLPTNLLQANSPR